MKKLISRKDRFAKLFKGYELRFTKFMPIGENENGKLEGSLKILDQGIHADDFEAHLNGERGVGVIPLTDENKVHFAAIDIDVYNEKEDIHFSIAKKVMNLPLVVTESKSGGVHIWLFSYDGIEASTAVEFLKTVAFNIGRSSCEIFPKQVSRKGKEDVGNPINIPYFNGDTRRVVCVVEEDGELKKGPQDINTFLRMAEHVAETTTEDSIKYQTTLLKSEMSGSNVAEDFLDGPPCLQRLFIGDPKKLATLKKKLEAGQITKQHYEEIKHDYMPQISDGGRNIAYFNAAQYLRRKYGGLDINLIKGKLSILNSTLNTGLYPSEIETIAKQGNKEYAYQCNECVMKELCNRKLCLSRKHGVGSQGCDVSVEITGFTKVDTDPPSYIFNINGIRARLSLDELLNNNLFGKAVFAATNRTWPRMPPAKHDALVDGWMKDAEIIPPPPGCDNKEIIKETLIDFIDDKTDQTGDDSSFYTGRVIMRDGKAIFKLDSLINYMIRHNVLSDIIKDRGRISDLLIQIGCVYKSTTIGGKSARVWIAYPAELALEEE